MNKLLIPVCFVWGHVIVLVPDKPGWYKSDCGRCGLSTHYRWFRRTRSIPYKIEVSLVWAANQIAKARGIPTYNPKYRPVDQQIKGLGTEHSCGAYSYEGIVSLLEQYKGDGLPEPLLSSLISEEGWINLEDRPEEIQPMLDEITKGVTLLQTKREQEELNK